MHFLVSIHLLLSCPFSLLNQEGSLMAFAGKSEKKEHVTAAIAANIWMSYENNSKAATEDAPLNLIVLNCEVGGAESHVIYVVTGTFVLIGS